MATVVLLNANALCYSIILHNAAAATAAHIHRGAAGTAGPIVINLPVPGGVPTRVANCIVGPAAMISAIRANPQFFYVNVHNGAFPAGAARGQLQ